jgi:hypothetical protein
VDDIRGAGRRMVGGSMRAEHEAVKVRQCES